MPQLYDSNGNFVAIVGVDFGDLEILSTKDTLQLASTRVFDMRYFPLQLVLLQHCYIYLEKKSSAYQGSLVLQK